MAEQNQCAHCQALNNQDLVTCWSCGKNMRDGPDAAAAPDTSLPSSSPPSLAVPTPSGPAAPDQASAVKRDRARLHHVIVALFLPVIGLPWGIVTVVKRRRASGLTMMILSGMILFVTIPILPGFLSVLAQQMAKQRDAASEQLRLAIIWGDVDTIKRLASEAPLYARPKDQDDIRGIAASALIQVIPALRRVDVNAPLSDGNTPLMEAVVNNKSAGLNALISAGAEVNAKNIAGQTALMRAAVHITTDSSCIKDLIAAGAEVNAPDNYGLTPLMQAILLQNDYDASYWVKALTSLGADANAKNANDNGITPLMLAALSGKTSFVHALIVAGANVHATATTVAYDNSATTDIETGGSNRLDANKALSISITGTNSFEEFESTKATTVHKTGVTALMLAAQLGHVECVNALVAANSDVKAKDSGGATALAYGKGHSDVVAALNAAGARE